MFSVRQGRKFQEKRITDRNEQVVFKGSRQASSKEHLCNERWAWQEIDWEPQEDSCSSS